LSRIFGLKKEEVKGKCRKLGNEELNDLCSSPNIVREITSRRMRWRVYIVGMEESCIQGLGVET